MKEHTFTARIFPLGTWFALHSRKKINLEERRITSTLHLVRCAATVFLSYQVFQWSNTNIFQFLWWDSTTSLPLLCQNQFWMTWEWTQTINHYTIVHYTIEVDYTMVHSKSIFATYLSKECVMMVLNIWQVLMHLNEQYLTW